MSYKLNYETPRPTVVGITLTVTPDELRVLRCYTGRVAQRVWTDSGNEIVRPLTSKISQAWEALLTAERKAGDFLGEHASKILVNGSITNE